MFAVSTFVPSSQDNVKPIGKVLKHGTNPKIYQFFVKYETRIIYYITSKAIPLATYCDDGQI